jgi:hypothetical protein
MIVDGDGLSDTFPYEQAMQWDLRDEEWTVGGTH